MKSSKLWQSREQWPPKMSTSQVPGPADALGHTAEGTSGCRWNQGRQPTDLALESGLGRPLCVIKVAKL